MTPVSLNLDSYKTKTFKNNNKVWCYYSLTEEEFDRIHIYTLCLRNVA